MDDPRGERPYVQLKEEAEGAVVRWAWGTPFLHDLRPYYAQRWGFGVPKRLKRPPAHRRRARQYGFDGDGRLRVIRTPTDLEGQQGEEFFWYGQGWAASRAYTHFDKHSAVASEFTYEDGRLVAAVRRTPRGSSEERYRYDGGRLSAVEFRGADGGQRTFRLEHHDDGSLARVREGGVTVFEAAPPSLSALLARAAELLVEGVMGRVRGLAVPGPVYCLALVYTRDYYMLPPELALGYEAQRAGWLQAAASRTPTAQGGRAWEHVWSPEEWQEFGMDAMRLDDPELVAVGTAIGHRLRAEGSEQAALDLLVKVAKALAKQDLGGAFETTSDFVVCALSLERGLTEASLASIPAATRKKLAAKGLLPRHLARVP